MQKNRDNHHRSPDLAGNANVVSANRDVLCTLWLPFSNIPSPASQNFDNLRGDSGCQGYPEEYEALVNSVRKSELSPQT